MKGKIERYFLLIAGFPWQCQIDPDRNVGFMRQGMSMYVILPLSFSQQIRWNFFDSHKITNLVIGDSTLVLDGDVVCVDVGGGCSFMTTIHSSKEGSYQLLVVPRPTSRSSRPRGQTHADRTGTSTHPSRPSPHNSHPSHSQRLSPCR